MKAEDFLKDGKVYIWKEDFAVIKSKQTCKEAFVNIVDKSETTVIIEESKVKQDYIIEIEKGWKILTFDMVLPFELTGFLSKVALLFADAKIGIFAISSFSTDHVLIKKEDLDKGKKVLKDLGCIIEEK